MRKLSLASLLFLVACGSSDPEPEQGGSQAASGEPSSAAAPDAAASDAEDGSAGSAAFEPAREWIALGFDLAARMPLDPHIKNRARFQGVLLDAAVDAGLLDQAAELAADVPNWRKGLAQASVAAAHAKAGSTAAAEAALAVAEASEGQITDEFDQGWRRDRVRAKIAETYAYLGQLDAAALIQSKLTPSEAGKLAPLSTLDVPAEMLDGRLDTLQEIARTGDLEQIKYALLAMAEFYGRFHADAERRKGIEERIRASWNEIPIQPRIEILERLVAFDLDAGDIENARFTVDEIASLVEENRWNAEEGIALRGRVAKWLARADEPKGARKAADDALALFETSRESIVSIWRGKALRPLAEAYLAMGDPATASALYQRALDEAMINPNGRPRTEDVVETIASMVRQRFAPDGALAKRLTEVAGEIDAPW